jgi:hypothetical protein
MNDKLKPQPRLRDVDHKVQRMLAEQVQDEQAEQQKPKQYFFGKKPTRYWLLTCATRMVSAEDYCDFHDHITVGADTMLEAEHFGLYIHVPEGFKQEGDPPYAPWDNEKDDGDEDMGGTWICIDGYRAFLFDDSHAFIDRGSLHWTSFIKEITAEQHDLFAALCCQPVTPEDEAEQIRLRGVKQKEP